MILALCIMEPIAKGDQQLHHRPVYTLHIGDVIALNYRLTPEFDQTVTVQPDGYVDLEVVGNVKVAGFTLNQVHDEIVKLASNAAESSRACNHAQAVRATLRCGSRRSGQTGKD